MGAQPVDVVAPGGVQLQVGGGAALASVDDVAVVAVRAQPGLVAGVVEAEDLNGHGMILPQDARLGAARPLGAPIAVS